MYLYIHHWYHWCLLIAYSSDTAVEAFEWKLFLKTALRAYSQVTFISQEISYNRSGLIIPIIIIYLGFFVSCQLFTNCQHLNWIPWNEMILKTEWTPSASPGNIYFTVKQFSMLCSIIFIIVNYFIYSVSGVQTWVKAIQIKWFLKTGCTPITTPGNVKFTRNHLDLLCSVTLCFNKDW